MGERNADREKGYYVDTPRGIFTASGRWFYTRVGALRDYAEPVLAHTSVNTLLHRAEHWLRGPDVLALWGLPFFLVVISPLPAVLCALTIYVGWKSLSPSFASRILAKVFGGLDKVLLQGLYYVFMLSFFAAQDRFVAVGIGLAGFVLIRWGLLDRLARPLVRRIWRSLYPLPVSDQVLRAFILRAALEHRVSVPHIDEMEEQILNNWYRSDHSK